MLKCKCCKQSKFGAILEEIKTTPITMANGEPVKVMEDKAQLETKVTITYCMTCKKEIDPEVDLYENETCPVCGKEVPELIDGICPECNEEKNKLAPMSKEELLFMILKQRIGSGNVQVSGSKKKKQVKEKVEEEIESKVEQKQVAASKDDDIDLSLDIDDDIDLLNEIDNVDVNIDSLDDYDDNNLF